MPRYILNKPNSRLFGCCLGIDFKSELYLFFDVDSSFIRVNNCSPYCKCRVGLHAFNKKRITKASKKLFLSIKKIPALREYIIKSKLKLVEIRLLNSDYTLTEIATELNFTDVSHLSKTFKKYTGMSIREFKKQGEYQLLKRSAC